MLFLSTITLTAPYELEKTFNLGAHHTNLEDHTRNLNLLIPIPYRLYDEFDLNTISIRAKNLLFWKNPIPGLPQVENRTWYKPG